MSKQNFEEKLEEIQKIKNVLTPRIPVAIYVQEAEDLYEWAMPDRKALKEAGLDISLLDDLQKRAGALRYSQSVWQKEFNTYEEAQKEWNEKSPRAFDLHDVLIHEFLHAYHDYPDLLSKVRSIAEGWGNADMLQDLSDLAVLGKANPKPFEKSHLDPALLDEAEALSAELSETLAKANGLRESDNNFKIIRDKAYTFLKIAVDEIRRNGQYKFWRTPERKKGYVSKYRKNKRDKGDNNEGNVD